MRWFNKKVAGLFPQFAGAAPSRVPDGVAVYAIGDIHGRLDLLNQILDIISADLNETPYAEATLAFLGDYVDRGPESRLVIEALKQLKSAGGDRVILLKGNHEEAFLGFLQDVSYGRAWVEHGGRETLLSYGVSLPADRADPAGWETVRQDFAAAVPPDHVRLLESLSLWEIVGDYVFVHAGVRPGVALADQQERDLLWIRDEFLEMDRVLDKVVVHGHTPEEQPTDNRWRIGIDTGAYATGVLTALKLHGETRTFLRTGGAA